MKCQRRAFKINDGYLRFVISEIKSGLAVSPAPNISNHLRVVLRNARRRLRRRDVWRWELTGAVEAKRRRV